VCGSDLPIGSRVGVDRDCREVGVVEGIEELGTELEADALTELYIFDRGKVPKLNTRTE
jgi:hypothetical protein